MRVIRDRSTKENREYWDFVEQTAKDVEEMYRRTPWMRVWGEHFLCNLDGSGRCNRGNGKQTCREFIESSPDETAPETPASPQKAQS